MAKILLIIAKEDFQLKEYSDTKEALENNGHTVITASNEKGEAISHIKSTVKVDLAINEIIINDYDGIYFIGGEGAPKYLNNDEVLNLIRDIEKNEKIKFGAICISPRLLVLAGVMDGKRMTGWNGDNNLREFCNTNNCEYIRERVVVDGRITTADGPMSAYEFGEKISSQF